MGNVASWLTGCLFPEEQSLWHAANTGNIRALRDAINALTPATRQSYLEWRDPCSGSTPLTQAAIRGKQNCVAALIEAGANVNAKDNKGNTPLHHACRHGRADVVRYLLQLQTVQPFEVNRKMMTPLDTVRHRLLRRDEDYSSRAVKHRDAQYEQCITELEQKFYVYSGWVFETTENLLSTVSGISNLNSWKRRFCIVLQRGLPDVLELAMFTVKRDVRPAVPKSVILYHCQSGFMETTDSKWFNRKNFVFSITGSVLQRDGESVDRRRGVATQTVELAGVDSESFQMWKSFFQHQQNMFAMNQTPPAGMAPHASVPASVPPPYMPPSQDPISMYPADWALVDHSCHPRRSSTAESSRTSVATTSYLRDEDQEDEDLRRAIELSLRTHNAEAPTTVTLPQPSAAVESSAPMWTDDETLPTSTTQHTPSTAHPVHSPIGECVVCFDGPQAAVCVPCGHNAVCMTCAEEILHTSRECPVCRLVIREVIKLYRV